jgi:hypothetical protein
MKTKPIRKTKINKVISKNKTNPIVIQSDVTQQTKPKITIVVSGGYIQDIIKERCLNTQIEVHDYDIQDEQENLNTDQYGKQYRIITF